MYSSRALQNAQLKRICDQTPKRKHNIRKILRKDILKDTTVFDQSEKNHPVKKNCCMTLHFLLFEASFFMRNQKCMKHITACVQR